MDFIVWILIGAVVGWVGYASNFNKERGRNVSMLIGAAGALVGAKAIAPMFVAVPAFSVAGLFFAAGAATALLALADLVYARWRV
jgi:uncharacterized membrane protein YeaQ/YmgE (transglycosylase-associated protein family)